MNITGLIKTSYDGANMAVTWDGTDGQKRTDNLSQRAQDQLLVALTVGPAGASGKVPRREPFVAQQVRLMQRSDGVLGLEVAIGLQMTIQILLPEPMPAYVAKILSEYPPNLQEPQKH